ncbi:MAG TPA: hypothetical protein PKD59_12880 [Miltoncostaeaceae bacterium]|nr:hypothetical protein [Miltoncostaeaceae bacterium]
MTADVAGIAAPVIAHARVLAAMERAGPAGVAAQVGWEDTRAATWDRLRAALRPVADAEGDSPAARLAAGVRALTERRILRLERGEALGDEPEGELAALAGSADADIVACAFLVDDLRRLDESGRIARELGWAMRRWAWAELHRALDAR